MNKGPILAVPACEPGRGGGHLIRCMALVRELRRMGREAWLFLPAAAAHTNRLMANAQFDQSWIESETNPHNKKWECIILDRFQTAPEELARWIQLAPVIGIDEGGPHRNNFDFLIDILPGCNGANIADPSLLPLPEKHERPAPRSETAPLKVLISFGQEDSAGLGLASAQALATAKTLAANNTGGVEITLLRGSLENNSLGATNQFVIKNAIPDLARHLIEYDVIITHYGLTAFEALYAGIPVLLVSPSAYHEKLAKATGFFSMGIGQGKAVHITKHLFSKGKINRAFLAQLHSRYAALAAKYNLTHAPRQSLAELVNTFTPDVMRNCSVCGVAWPENGGIAIARFAERSYRHCKCCGIINMDRLNPPPIEYEREYFFEFYQKQYGKTYIEDFPNLIAMGKRRLAVIKSLLPNGLLLDIGCAYGPFLAAAREEGFSPFGIDPAEDAVRYVTGTLGIPAVQGFFPLEDASALPHPCDVVSLWYVIEHFRDCVPVLAEIQKLLKPGGVLAFSTPSFSGISGRSSLKHFLERSPTDHWTVWSPIACKKALAAAGFTVKKIINCGHHPERFPLLGKYAQNKKSLLYRLLMAISVIFSLGDTFEVYAVKEPPLCAPATAAARAGANL